VWWEAQKYVQCVPKLKTKTKESNGHISDNNHFNGILTTEKLIGDTKIILEKLLIKFHEIYRVFHDFRT
jgi:hypothetical protein